ncbi:MAG: STAS domain-containing protein [Spirochaetaceae bacterium]|jgi:anti-sigma B factor antagonist|nr:STAS domain-containing protein [Spirochaetaceae bacterium]
MKIEKIQAGDEVTLQLNGKLTAAATQDLNQCIESVVGAASKLVLDFKDISFLASAGLRVLLCAKKKFSAEGAFVIRNVRREVMDVFEITGLNNIFTIEN